MSVGKAKVALALSQRNALSKRCLTLKSLPLFFCKVLTACNVYMKSKLFHKQYSHFLLPSEAVPSDCDELFWTGNLSPHRHIY